MIQGGGYIFNTDDGDFFGSGRSHIPGLLGTTFALATPPAFPGLSDVLGFSNGSAVFDLVGIAPDAVVSATETLTTGFRADTYYVFGPTADNATPHRYGFLYDGMTGAEINGNPAMPHFVDGTIVDPEASARKANISGSSGGGGGCSLVGESGRSAQAGACWLLFTLIALLRIRSAGAECAHVYRPGRGQEYGHPVDVCR